MLNRSDAKVGPDAPTTSRPRSSQPIAVHIPNSLAVPASVNRGVPIVLDEPRHPVSQALKALARRPRPPAALGGERRRAEARAGAPAVGC